MTANRRNLPPHHYTLEEYFALEHAGEARYEYWDGEILCMSGGSRQHARISGNVYLAIGQQLKGTNCVAYTSDLPIRTPSLPPYRYPDASVACGELIFETINGVDVLTNPILLVEVLSPGTENLDRGEKRAAYQGLASLKELLLIAQDAPHITQFVRQSKTKWKRRDYGDLTAKVELTSLACQLLASDIYDGIEFI